MTKDRTLNDAEVKFIKEIFSITPRLQGELEDRKPKTFNDFRSFLGSLLEEIPLIHPENREPAPAE